MHLVTSMCVQRRQRLSEATIDMDSRTHAVTIVESEAQTA